MFHHKSAVLLNKKQDQITSQHRIPSAELQQNYSTNFLLNIDNVFLISREWPDTFGVAWPQVWCPCAKGGSRFGYIRCCVFWPANGCCVSASLYKIWFLTLFQFFVLQYLLFKFLFANVWPRIREEHFPLLTYFTEFLFFSSNRFKKGNYKTTVKSIFWIASSTLRMVIIYKSLVKLV